MAWLWTQGDSSITTTEAENKITDMSDYELANHGNYHDTSAQDTAKWLLGEYFNYDKYSVTENVSISFIKDKLREGKLVLVPANGQKLNNPNFLNGGPVTHMVVIRGFDDAKQEFITNDPGTRNGKLYVYDYQTLYSAMVNYPTGYHLPQEGRPKAAIVVEK
jgi:hypothetical protein